MWYQSSFNLVLCYRLKMSLVAQRESQALYFGLLSVNSWHTPLVLLTNKACLVSCTVSYRPPTETLLQGVFIIVSNWIRRHNDQFYPFTVVVKNSTFWSNTIVFKMWTQSFTWLQFRHPSASQCPSPYVNPLWINLHFFVFRGRAIWHQQITCFKFSQVCCAGQQGLPKPL